MRALPPKLPFSTRSTLLIRSAGHPSAERLFETAALGP